MKSYLYSFAVLGILVYPGYSMTPNVIVLMADDLGWGDVEYPMNRSAGNTYSGDPILKTPNLAKMSAAGMRFDRFYAASPVCSPTRASMLSGRHGARHGINGPQMHGDHGKIRNRELTIAEIAKSLGYMTGHFGKWHVGSLTKHTYDMRRGRVGNSQDYSPPWCNGYDTVFSSENWMPTYDPYDVFPHHRVVQAAYFTGPSDALLTTRVPNDLRVDDRHESEIIANQFLHFLDAASADPRPFLATVWFSTPHIPLMETPDASYDGLGLSPTRRRYCEAITQMDRQIGKIRERVKQLGIDRQTLIVFTSDNGPQDPKIGSTGGLRGKKRSLYEGGIRVPTLLEWTGRTTSGYVSMAMGTTNDLLPTMLEAWGVAMPDDRPIDGKSLLPIIDQEADERPPDYLFCSAFRTHRMAMDNQHKLISTDKGESYELYDILDDPTEQCDLLREGPTREAQIKRKVLRDRLDEWLSSCERSKQGADFESRIFPIRNAQVEADVEVTAEPSEVVINSLGEVDYEDRYQIVEGQFEHADRATVFVERQYATLETPILSDGVSMPGHDANRRAFPLKKLPAGQVAHSFLVHFDPPDSPEQMSIEVVLDFKDPIVGILSSPERLKESDYLAFAEPVFSSVDSPPQRIALPNAITKHACQISQNSKRLTLRLTAGSDQINQVRVLTAATVPRVRPQPHHSQTPSSPSLKR
ncbi:sulfatase family protein [Adhaeretor mobilis]|uniref:Arylsulfatase n=1 Tax=Adhaeretor mobilis TaxID=1930276 RepID=A0A517MTF4_9BACT|nr:sulfatase-like hydrolase/transferase [Adhaeretor mobilis]QDS98154.1 Arylsulfatase precursor [Adhaeretor mobilis]